MGKRKIKELAAADVKSDLKLEIKSETTLGEESPKMDVAEVPLSSIVDPKDGWKWLGTTRAELTLDFTLPTGQSFRWRQSGPSDYTGVIGQRLVQIQQPGEDVAFRILARGPGAEEDSDEAVLRDYFNLDTRLAEMANEWAEKDSRFRLVSPYFPGARIMRQNPAECLFQFICSSNNHISRIHGMVERLCREYGTPLQQLTGTDNTRVESVSVPPEKDPVAYYSFPSLQQLSAASEQSLRADGFGYRAKFITGTVKALLAADGGGEQWLLNLRSRPYPEAQQALISLPGIGPKVAACICLFSLDKHEAIPVDTHVWQLALKHYTPHLKGKTLTPKIMGAVENAFIAQFGPYAGWAHNVLFISDLSSSREVLPPHLWPKTPAKSEGSKKQKLERRPMKTDAD